MEAKLQVTQQGYLARALKLEERVMQASNDYYKTVVDLGNYYDGVNVHSFPLTYFCAILECYQYLEANEERALRRRHKRALEEVDFVEKRELELQKRFKSAQERYTARFRL